MDQHLIGMLTVNLETFFLKRQKQKKTIKYIKIFTINSYIERKYQQKPALMFALTAYFMIL